MMQLLGIMYQAHQGAVRRRFTALVAAAVVTLADSERAYAIGATVWRENIPDTLLRAKIALGAAMVIGGLYLFSNAFRKEFSVNSNADTLYAVCGVVCMLFGILIGADAFLRLP